MGDCGLLLIVMKIRTLGVALALVVSPFASANAILCNLDAGNGSPLPAAGCNSVFAYTNTFDWASLNPSPLGPTSGPTYVAGANPDIGGMPWAGTSSGETVTASLTPDNGTPYLQLDGNTAFVYTGVSRHSPTGYSPATSETAVQLGFPTIDPDNPILWYYGETLLAEPNGAAPITIAFSNPVSGVGLQLSTINSPDFIATLVAYSSTGQTLGTFVLNTNGTGVGGTCGSLFNSPGAPCSTPAPFIGITDRELNLGAGMIAKVAVYTNVPDFAIGTMDLIETPEPSGLLLAAVGLGLVAWRRRKVARAACE
jgi:hypothetical protein